MSKSFISFRFKRQISARSVSSAGFLVLIQISQYFSASQTNILLPLPWRFQFICLFAHLSAEWHFELFLLSNFYRGRRRYCIVFIISLWSLSRWLSFILGIEACKWTDLKFYANHQESSKMCAENMATAPKENPTQSSDQRIYKLPISM